MGTNIFRAVNSTLIYLERGDEYLMLHRTKKENDLNHDKWIGVGGKFEDSESPEDCALRETREETGLTLTRWRYRGLVTFVSDRYETEYMHLFTADGWTGKERAFKAQALGGRQDLPAAARHGRAVFLAQAQVRGRHARTRAA